MKLPSALITGGTGFLGRRLVERLLAAGRAVTVLGRTPAPDLEARGVKIAHDRHGPPIDPDSGDRMPSAQAIADVREFMKRRFPALANRPLVESRVCQYENSSNGDFLIDRHPQWENVVLVGAGSGHGFKHGPAVGTYAAQLVNGTNQALEPRFNLQSKAAQQRRDVH